MHSFNVDKCMQSNLSYLSYSLSNKSIYFLLNRSEYSEGSDIKLEILQSLYYFHNSSWYEDFQSNIKIPHSGCGAECGQAMGSFLGSMLPQYMALYVSKLVSQFVKKKF